MGELLNIATTGKVTRNESTGTLASGWPGGSDAMVSIINRDFPVGFRPTTVVSHRA